MNGDAFLSHHPSPKPPIKGSEVQMKVLKGVRSLAYTAHGKFSKIKQSSITNHKTVDDEDGHYVVVSDSDLTDRCKLNPAYFACVF